MQSDPSRQSCTELQAPTKLRVFISYSRTDAEFADRLASSLANHGIAPFIDRREIAAFEEWWRRIQSLIIQADTIIAVISADYIKSDDCYKEIQYATSLNKRIAPIVYRSTNIAEVPQELSRLNLIFFNEPSLYDENLIKLIDALESDVDWIRQHTEYGQAAQRWIGADRPNGLLLHTPVMEVAEHWLGSRPKRAPEPTAETRMLVEESRKSLLISQRRTRVTHFSIYSLLTSVIVGLIGWINQDYITEQWRWWSHIYPYIRREVQPYVLTAQKESDLKPLETFTEWEKHCPEMIVIPSGTFMMGSPEDEAFRYENEGPQHTVTISRPFAVSKTSVTFDQWDRCVEYGNCDPQIKDGGWGHGHQPVINVTWEDAKRYAAWLSSMTGKRYRLLSEAEWEYAARGGATTAFHFGDDPWLLDQYAWFDRNAGEKTHPVGQKKPNKFGLFDVHGNVFSWVQDCYHPNYYGAPSDGAAWIAEGDCGQSPMRGGAWFVPASRLRTADRVPVHVDARLNGSSLRIARLID